jgi:hypothetical protein
MNEAQLVQAVFPDRNPANVLADNFSLPAQAWVDWFNDSAVAGLRLSLR